MKLQTFLLSILLLPLVVAADDALKPQEKPHNQKAKAAIEKHRIAADKLRVDYYTKLVAADEQLIKDLDASLKAAASSNGDAAEIERISSARKSAQSELEQDRGQLAGPKYWLWVFEGSGNHWLKSDGTVINGDKTGRWERHGNRIIINWPTVHVIDTMNISDDGLSCVGVNNNGAKFTAKFAGTDLTGAEAPPN